MVGVGLDTGGMVAPSANSQKLFLFITALFGVPKSSHSSAKST